MKNTYKRMDSLISLNNLLSKLPEVLFLNNGNEIINSDDIANIFDNYLVYIAYPN